MGIRKVGTVRKKGDDELFRSARRKGRNGPQRPLYMSGLAVRNGCRSRRKDRVNSDTGEWQKRLMGEDDRIWRGAEAYMVTLMYPRKKGTYRLVSRGLHLYSVLVGNASPHPFLNFYDLALQCPFPGADEPDGPLDTAY